MAGRLRELLQEFRTVFGGQNRLIDALLPPILFFLLNQLLGLIYAIAGALVVAIALAGLRVIQGRRLMYAAIGLFGVVLASVGAYGTQSARGFFLPNLLTNLLLIIVALISVAVGRPLVAWTSHIARGWPIEWYWHARVRPAYTEVTIAWAVYFALQLGLQYLALTGEDPLLLGVVAVLGGWPATIVLLAASYLYGIWRLGTLGGPSVEEFEAGADPPWEGQQQGF